MTDIEAKRFLDLIQKRKKGKLKAYIGMIAGVGKTYRSPFNCWNRAWM